MSKEQKKLTTTKTGILLQNIIAINNDFVSFYLIMTSSGYIAFDCGADNDKTQMELSSQNILPSSIKAVFLTHTHGDHIQGLKIFKNATIFGVDKEYADVTINDGETITHNGFVIQVIATQGHKEDSVCYLVNGEHLFVGDNMGIKDNKIILFDSVYNNCDKKQAQDIKMLSKINGIKNIFTAHYGWTDNPNFVNF